MFQFKVWKNKNIFSVAEVKKLQGAENKKTLSDSIVFQVVLQHLSPGKTLAVGSILASTRTRTASWLLTHAAEVIAFSPKAPRMLTFARTDKRALIAALQW